LAIGLGAGRRGHVDHDSIGKPVGGPRTKPKGVTGRRPILNVTPDPESAGNRSATRLSPTNSVETPADFRVPGMNTSKAEGLASRNVGEAKGALKSNTSRV
jgi:hypothetical protein